MKVHEYQAKAILAEFGIPVPKGGVAATADEAKAVAQGLGGTVVVKAQVHAGGRGKAGGIIVAKSPDEAADAAKRLIGTRLVTHQTGPEGAPISTVLVEEATTPAQELYLGILLDSQKRQPVIMASAAGGMDIEEVAATAPEKIIRLWVDPTIGYQPFAGRQLAYGIGLPQELIRPAADLIGKLYEVYIKNDCSLVEINPLVVTEDNKLSALDAKLNIDDNALFRHSSMAELRDPSQEDPLEVEAIDSGVNNYIKLTGNIGCIVNGAGLAMATLDIIKLYGGDAANFLDIGTVNNPQRMVSAISILIRDPDVKAIYVNILGGMARVDVIAEGLVEAYQQFEIKVPVVARLTGNGLKEGIEILAKAGLPIIEAADMADGAQKAVAAAAG